jgi:hypothetical protein
MHNEHIFGPISQLGYVTDDIEATARMWTATSGIGPWTRMRGVTMTAIMEGKPTDISIDVALAYKGDVQIELIKPLCDSPSPYQENKRAGLWGLHHVQFQTKNMAESIELAKSAGLEVSCKIDQGGGIYNYLRGPGVWFEIMEAGEGLVGLFEMIKSASDGWDGQELIRDFGL